MDNTITKSVVNLNGQNVLRVTVQPPTPPVITPPTPDPEITDFSLSGLQESLSDAQADLVATQTQQPNDLADFVAAQASVITQKQAAIADLEDSITTLQAATQ
jgi:hypothetical protein